MMRPAHLSGEAAEQRSRMPLLSIRLRYVDWRDGKPMFKPAGKLYRLGFRAMALRHPPGPDGRKGRWFTLEEAIAFAAAKQAEIEAALAARPLMPPQAPRARKKILYALDDLLEDFLGSPKARELAPATLRDYRGKAAALQKFDPELTGCAAAALDQPILFDLYERLRGEKGLSQSRGIMAVVSAALSWGMLRGKVRFASGVNPATRLRMTTPKPRLRIGEIVEMRALVAAADALGRPEIGDAIMLGLWTGQRQGDRLALVDEGLVAGRRVFRQSKTGAVVAIREAPELAARLAAARLRRADWKVEGLKPLVVMDEQTRKPFRGDWYRHLYAAVRAFAATGKRGEPSPLVGEGGPRSGSDEGGAKRSSEIFPASDVVEKVIAPCPSLSTFRDQDLRDTAVTWMALAGATIPEIIAVTGHTPGQAADILKHYLGRHPELADAAIAKMAAWYDREGSA